MGHSQDAPTRPPINVMLGALEPLEMPWATEVWLGERAEEGLDLPRSERIEAGLHHPALLLVGDGKMSA